MLERLLIKSLPIVNGKKERKVVKIVANRHGLGIQELARALVQYPVVIMKINSEGWQRIFMLCE